jgi:hypothetical protein
MRGTKLETEKGTGLDLGARYETYELAKQLSRIAYVCGVRKPVSNAELLRVLK